jgi:hypothetical protein
VLGCCGLDAAGVWPKREVELAGAPKREGLGAVEVEEAPKEKGEDVVLDAWRRSTSLRQLWARVGREPRRRAFVELTAGAPNMMSDLISR